jgi:hypothetical protein
LAVNFHQGNGRFALPHRAGRGTSMEAVAAVAEEVATTLGARFIRE